MFKGYGDTGDMLINLISKESVGALQIIGGDYLKLRIHQSIINRVVK